MDSYSTPTAAEDRGFRKWFFWALVVSLLIHGVLALIFRASELERFDAGVQTERLVPRAFSIKQAQIDPKVFEPEKETPKKMVDTPKPPAVTPEKPIPSEMPDKVTLTPTATELVKPILNEKPALMDGNMAKVARPEVNAAVQSELDSLREQLVNDGAPKVAPSSQLNLPPGPAPVGNEGAGKADAPGFSNLDDLLSQAGPLSGSVAPVAMPGGALFEYDSAELRSVEMLRKLGEVIRRNPRATFSIEGHSDSFGDAAYNQKLSELRAEAVKTWLVDNMGVDASKIETKGFGSSRLIAPSTGTPEEQQINRRVEIVIRTPKD